MQSNHWEYPLFPTALRCVIPLPAAPVHGRRNVTGLTFGSTVVYSCGTGYTLNGSSTITCMANSQWSGNTPDCNRKLEIHQICVSGIWLCPCSPCSPSVYCCFHLRSFCRFFLELYILESVVECLPSGTNHTSCLPFVLAPV